MTLPKTKEAYYERIKTILKRHDLTVNPFRLIQHGLQFLIFENSESILLRIYDGKKGLRLDWSQASNTPLKTRIISLITAGMAPQIPPQPISELFTDEPTSSQTEDPDELIGVDESGKGDYFGPLVVAGVYTNPILTPQLEEMDIKDSKQLSPLKIKYLAKRIKSIAPHIVIQIGNESYNEIYSEIKNLNHMLAWGHAKAIEDILKQVHSAHALSDQFANPKLLKNALVNKGINITLHQRHRAEDNIAVAAASILARDAFVSEIKRYEQTFKMIFPKGCSSKTKQAATQFCQQHGTESLHLVSKLHFKLTDELALN